MFKIRSFGRQEYKAWDVKDKILQNLAPHERKM